MGILLWRREQARGVVNIDVPCDQSYDANKVGKKTSGY